MSSPSGGDGFRADVPHIRSHSGEVKGYADSLGTAHSAAQTTMNSNAFGIFGQFLALHVVAMSELVKFGIDSGTKSMGQLSETLDEAATTYQRTDEENMRLLERFRDQ